MNCCHQDIPNSCHGGDNCPARCAYPALVARIKASTPVPQPAPAPARTSRLRRVAGALGWVALGCITFLLLTIPALQLVLAGQRLGEWL